MSTLFPNSVDAFPSAATLAAQTLGAHPHSVLHGDLGDAVSAIELWLLTVITTSNVPEGGRLYFTNARAVAAGAGVYQPVGSYLTALTGDVTAAGPGSSAATLATVVAAGTYGLVQVDVKGRVIAGTVACDIAHGGTGQTTAQAALDALLPAQSTNAGKVLQTDGTHTSWVIPASGAPGGASGQFQYNNAGAFAGVAGVTTGANTLLVVTAQAATDVLVTLKAHATQSASLAEYRNSSNALVAQLSLNTNHDALTLTFKTAFGDLAIGSLDFGDGSAAGIFFGQVGSVGITDRVVSIQTDTLGLGHFFHGLPADPFTVRANKTRFVIGGLNTTGLALPGGVVHVVGGDGEQTGNFDGGAVHLTGGVKGGTGKDGPVILGRKPDGTKVGAVVFGGANAAPADAQLANSQLCVWLDDTAGATKVMFKAKDSAGTVRTGNIALV